MKKLLAIPNCSEGRDLEKIEKLAAAVKAVPGAKLIDYSSDKDHNRSVFTIIGDPEPVYEAVKVFVDLAVELIDMSKQTGAHPRQGAVDVAPFIPVGDLTTEEALVYARRLGKHIGDDLGIPVYYYEDAATRPERTSLVKVRKGQYEALEEKLSKPEWAPDEGPAKFVPKSGAIQVAARFPLVAFNVNLATKDVQIATNIGNAVRNLTGGFRYVRAMGLDLEGTELTQVSMNLINYVGTPIYRVFEAIKAEAKRYGVSVVASELIGAVPLPALMDVCRYYLQCHDVSMEQVVEMSLID